MKQAVSDSQSVNHDLLKLFRLFRRKLWVLILCAVLGLLIGGFYRAFFVPTEYSANVLLYIWQDNEDRNSADLTTSDLNLFSQLVYDYQTLVTSRLVTRQVADELAMTTSQYETLPKKITVDTKANTRQILISVVDKDASSAALIANTIAKYFSQAVVEKMGTANLQIIDPAVVPDKPVPQGTLMILAIGGFVGLLLGIGLILLISSLDTTIRTAGDVESLSDFPLLGLIHEYERTPVNGEGAFTVDQQNMPIPRYNIDLITRLDQQSATSEAFKALRTYIEFSMADRKFRSLMVTSTLQDEGKTVSLANLAITFAQMGRRVLMVDADLHSPSLHKYFGLANHGGLTSVLTGIGHYSEYVRPTLTENLSILTAGPIPSNPADLLISQSMSDLIFKFTNQYDLVLIDCSPIGVVADALIVATKVDATVFFVRSGVTNRYQISRAISLLGQVRASVLGFIMNGVNKKSDDYFHADGRFAKKSHGWKTPAAAENQGMMKASPLLEAPAKAKNTNDLFKQIDGYKPDISTGRRPDKTNDWRG